MVISRRLVDCHTWRLFCQGSLWHSEAIWFSSRIQYSHQYLLLLLIKWFATFFQSRYAIHMDGVFQFVSCIFYCRMHAVTFYLYIRICYSIAVKNLILVLATAGITEHAQLCDFIWQNISNIFIKTTANFTCFSLSFLFLPHVTLSLRCHLYYTQFNLLL